VGKSKAKPVLVYRLNITPLCKGAVKDPGWVKNSGAGGNLAVSLYKDAVHKNVAGGRYR
jgi:hypothetical protein